MVSCLRCSVAAAALVACFVATLACAQTAPPSGSGADAAPSHKQPPAPVHKLDSVEVTRKVDPRIESTAARIVIGHDELVRYGDTALEDVLRRLPGITVVTVTGGVDIRMRGLGSGYTQILIDGEPVPRGFSLDSLSPDSIERIEILRAPVAEVSAQAIAGTINIVLRKSVRRSQRDLKVTLQDAAGRPTFAADGSLAERHGALSWGLGVNVSRTERDQSEVDEQGSTDASGRVVQSWVTRSTRAPRIDNLTLTPRVSWTAGDDDTLSADLFARAQRVDDSVAERTTTLLGAPPAFASDVLPFRADSAFLRGRTEWKHRSASGASLDAKAGFNYFHRFSDAAFRAFDADDAFVLDRTVRSGATERGLVTNGKYRAPLLAGHALALGWDDEYTDRREYRRQHDVTFDGAPPYDLDETYDARVWRIAAYVQDEWDITPRWSAYAGLRWEGIDTRVTGNAIVATHNRSDVLSPTFQTLWKLPGSEQDQVRFSAARTYKAPATFQLTPRRYVANNNTVTTPDIQGNPDLRPELAWGVDAAYEHHWGDDGLMSVSAYARHIDDVILQQLRNVDGTWIVSPANSGKARVYGVEAEAKLDVRSWWPKAPNLRVRANVARNWSFVDDVPGPDNRLERQTPLSANVGFDYLPPALPLTVGANFGVQTGGFVRIAENRSAYESVRRTLDAYALWKVDAKTSLRLALANALAQDEVAVTRYSDANGATELTSISPTHMAVRLTVELKL